ncbi:putative protein kinase RLK-Pelle-DLSV family [Helianthus anomalus]
MSIFWSPRSPFGVSWHFCRSESEETMAYTWSLWVPLVKVDLMWLLGKLTNGSMFAIKQLSSRSKQGTEEFLADIATISMLNHENLVKLIGFCAHKPLCLVYEYMTNNSLSPALSELLNISGTIERLTRGKMRDFGK